MITGGKRRKGKDADLILINRATFLATTVLASLHIMRTRRGPAQQTHAGWVGKQEPVQI